jgi:hypothetical protein
LANGNGSGPDWRGLGIGTVAASSPVNREITASFYRTWIIKEQRKIDGSGRFYRVLMMVYNTQNYWVFGLCPSSGF